MHMQVLGGAWMLAGGTMDASRCWESSLGNGDVECGAVNLTWLGHRIAEWEGWKGPLEMI